MSDLVGSRAIIGGVAADGAVAVFRKGTTPDAALYQAGALITASGHLHLGGGNEDGVVLVLSKDVPLNGESGMNPSIGLFGSSATITVGKPGFHGQHAMSGTIEVRNGSESTVILHGNNGTVSCKDVSLPSGSLLARLDALEKAIEIIGDAQQNVPLHAHPYLADGFEGVTSGPVPIGWIP